MKGFIAFIVLITLPLIFWISETGLELRQQGYGLIPWVYAPISAFLFAFISVGKPGQGLFTRVSQGEDRPGVLLIGAFWGIFIFVTIAQIGIAYALTQDA